MSRAAERAVQAFQRHYGRPPRWVVSAPGRVNLIGEHLDYNGGPVLPMAINRYTVLAADLADSGAGRLGSGQADPPTVVDLAARPPAWTRYVTGTLAVCAATGLSLPACEMWLESDVPPGCGLSSSAALEVAAATLAEAILGRTLPPLEKARLCQQAEQRHAGVPCGIMDQAISAAALAGYVMLLDCRDDSHEMIPFDDSRVSVLIADSHARHTLSESPYATRREECRRAAAGLEVPALCAADSVLLERARETLAPVLFRRARHVVSETARVRQAADCLRQRDWRGLGRLMDAGHDSLRDDFEASCPELDLLVEIARRIGPDGGVYGTRMTGAGFGGCTVSLIETESAAEIQRRMQREYQARTGIAPTMFLTPAARGAHAMRGDDQRTSRPS